MIPPQSQFISSFRRKQAIFTEQDQKKKEEMELCGTFEYGIWSCIVSTLYNLVYEYSCYPYSNINLYKPNWNQINDLPIHIYKALSYMAFELDLGVKSNEDIAEMKSTTEEDDKRIYLSDIVDHILDMYILFFNLPHREDGETQY